MIPRETKVLMRRNKESYASVNKMRANIGGT